MLDWGYNMLFFPFEHLEIPAPLGPANMVKIGLVLMTGLLVTRLGFVFLCFF